MKLLADTYSPILVIGNYLKMGDIIGGDFSMNNYEHSFNMIVIQMMAMLVVDMVLLTDTLSINVKIQVNLRIWMGRLKMVMLVMDMVLLGYTLVFNRMVQNN